MEFLVYLPLPSAITGIHRRGRSCQTDRVCHSEKVSCYLPHHHRHLCPYLTTTAVSVPTSSPPPSLSLPHHHRCLCPYLTTAVSVPSSPLPSLSIPHHRLLCPYLTTAFFVPTCHIITTYHHWFSCLHFSCCDLVLPLQTDRPAQGSSAAASAEWG